MSSLPKKEKLRHAFTARDKEAKHKRSLEKVCHASPHSIHQIVSLPSALVCVP